MRTTDYPYYQCKFFEFNIVQSAVVPWLDKDVNLVVAFKTATGKTALAECAFGYHLQTNFKSKVVYVSPFKSISSERYEAWASDSQFLKHGILVCTSDNIPSQNDFDSSRIYIMTSESLDSKTRTPRFNQNWVNDISCVVFDEAHILSLKGRGSSIERTIMHLTSINPKIRIILLSATMTNAIELARWLKYLNGKETKCIQSDWRPVKIVYNYHTYNDNENRDVSDSDKIRVLKDLIKKNQREKTLIFVHSKRTGKLITNHLRKSGIRCAFHNASLSASKRDVIEKLFSDKYSGFDVLVSTSTLGSGVNLC